MEKGLSYHVCAYTFKLHIAHILLHIAIAHSKISTDITRKYSLLVYLL